MTSCDDLVFDMPAAKYQLRVDDLRSWHVLVVTCMICRHQGRIYPTLLHKKFPPHSRLLDIEHQFVCQACGNKADNSWKVYRLSRDA